MGEIYKLTLTYIDIQHVTPCNSNTECSCTMLYMCYHVLINPMRVHIRDPSPLWCPMWYCYLLSRPGCDEDRPQGDPENPKSPVQPSQSGALGTLWYPVCRCVWYQWNSDELRVFQYKMTIPTLTYPVPNNNRGSSPRWSILYTSFLGISGTPVWIPAILPYFPIFSPIFPSTSKMLM